MTTILALWLLASACAGLSVYYGMEGRHRFAAPLLVLAVVGLAALLLEALS